MKLGTRDSAAFFRKPDPAVPAVLIHGEDPMQVADRRRQLALALVGPEGEAEMRLTRIAAAELRKDGAALDEAMRAQGFFPGPRAAIVDEATDGLSAVILGALGDWRPGDATIVVTAGHLPAKSTLRKGFEAHPRAIAIALYDEPPGPADVAEMLQAAGLGDPGAEAKAAILALSRSLDPGDFRQTLDKLGLYKRGDSTPLSAADIAACAPQSTEADTDDLIAIVAEGRRAEIAGVLRRLYAQGVLPVGLCINTLRHFRALHTILSDPGGAGEGIGRLRPPVWGPRRDQLLRQAGLWSRDRIERALAVLIETDLQLRSASKAPDRALVERALIRLAMMARARG